MRRTDKPANVSSHPLASKGFRRWSDRRYSYEGETGGIEQLGGGKGRKGKD